MTQFLPPLAYHGATWTPEQEVILQDMYHDGEELHTIARTVGRSCNACAQRLRQIRTTGPLRSIYRRRTATAQCYNRSSSFKNQGQQYPIPNTTPSTQTPAAPTKAESLSSKIIDNNKIVSEKSIVSPLSSSSVPTQAIRNSTAVSAKDVVIGMKSLQVQPTPPPTFCQYCDRPAMKICNIQQSVCSQCKSVQDNYNTTGLSHLIQKIKNAAALPWRHTPIPKEVHGYITQVEYQKHLDTTPPNTTKNGIKERKKRGSCESLVNIAEIYGLVDLFTCIQGHWSPSENDPCCRLTFAYVKDNNEKSILLPTLTVIAQMAQNSTEETIQQWVTALQQKR